VFKSLDPLITLKYELATSFVEELPEDFDPFMTFNLLDVVGLLGTNFFTTTSNLFNRFEGKLNFNVACFQGLL
jgi:hypothetical protein